MTICILCHRRAVKGRQRCEEHGGRAWARVPKGRQAAYRDPLYLQNRKRVLQGDPRCHWCKRRKATQADHLVSVSAGGTHDLSNLVPACKKCNQERGAAEGRNRQKRGNATDVTPTPPQSPSEGPGATKRPQRPIRKGPGANPQKPPSASRRWPQDDEGWRPVYHDDLGSR